MATVSGRQRNVSVNCGQVCSDQQRNISVAQHRQIVIAKMYCAAEANRLPESTVVELNVEVVDECICTTVEKLHRRSACAVGDVDRRVLSKIIQCQSGCVESSKIGLFSDAKR